MPLIATIVELGTMEVPSEALSTLAAERFQNTGNSSIACSDLALYPIRGLGHRLTLSSASPDKPVVCFHVHSLPALLCCFWAARHLTHQPSSACCRVRLGSSGTKHYRFVAIVLPSYHSHAVARHPLARPLWLAVASDVSWLWLCLPRSGDLASVPQAS